MKDNLKLEKQLIDTQLENMELKKEIVILKKNQRYYKNGVFSLEYDKETMSDMIDEYKSRCEKAIEYIHTGIGKSLKEEYCCFEILLNILNGLDFLNDTKGDTNENEKA